MQIIDDALLDTFRGTRACAWCGWAGPVEPHHLFGRGMGGGSQLDIRINLIALCRRCHNAHHAGGHPRRAELTELIAKREGRYARAMVYELRRLQNADEDSQASHGDVQAGPGHQRDDLPAPESPARPARGESGVEVEEDDGWDTF